MLYEYFNQDDVFIKPGFLMIDTPLLGLDENEDGFDGETIKKGLYQYFINHQGEGQVIIVDNLNAMPDMDLSHTESMWLRITRMRKKDIHTALCQVGERIFRRRQHEIII